MQRDVTQFLQYLEVIKNASDHTLRNYRIDLIGFVDSIDVPVKRVGKYDIRDYIAQLNEDGMSRRTILRRISSLRSFFKYLTRKRVIRSDPMQLIDSPKAPGHLPRALSYEMVERLIESPNTLTLLGVRDRAIFELFYSSGLRVSELIELNRDDFDGGGLWVRVRGKGKQERVIPVTETAKGWIDKYLTHPERHLDIDGHKKQNDPQAIFLNRWGDRLTVRSVDRLFKGYLTKCGFAEVITPHTIRHTIATHWLEKGMDLKTIQTLLGHKTLSATTIYTKVSTGLKQKVYEKAHPRAK